MFNNHILRLVHEFPEKVKWGEIYDNSNLTLTFIRKNYPKLGHSVLGNINITLEFIEEICENNQEKYLGKKEWKTILGNYNLDFREQKTLNFIEKYFGEIHKYLKVLSSKNLTEEFIKTHSNAKWRLSDLSINKNISPEFVISLIVDHSFPEFCWKYLSIREALSEEILNKYSDKLDWKYISKYQNLTSEFIKKYFTYLEWEGQPNLHHNPSITIEIIEEYIEKIDWRELSRNLSLKLEILEKYHHKLYWKYISENFNLDVSNTHISTLIDLYQEEIDWDALSLNRHLTLEIVEKYQTKWDYILLLKNEYLELEILEKYFDLRDFKNRKNELFQNHFLTYDFIKKYKLLEMIDSFRFFWENEMNLNPIVKAKNLKKYSRALAVEIPQELIRRETLRNHVLYKCCVHEIKLNIRDTKLGTISFVD